METANLLPLSYRRKQLVRSRARIWMIAFLGVCGAASVQVAREQHRLNELEVRLQQETARALQDRQLMEKTEALRKQVKNFDRQAGIAAMVDRARLPLQTLGLIARQADNRTAPVVIRSFHLQTARQPTAPRPRNAAPAAVNDGQETVRVGVRGTAATDAGVSGFVQRLRHCEAFDSVELKSVTGQAERDGSSREFQIECLFNAERVRLVHSAEVTVSAAEM